MYGGIKKRLDSVNASLDEQEVIMEAIRAVSCSLTYHSNLLKGVYEKFQDNVENQLSGYIYININTYTQIYIYIVPYHSNTKHSINVTKWGKNKNNY